MSVQLVYTNPISISEATRSRVEAVKQLLASERFAVDTSYPQGPIENVLKDCRQRMLEDENIESIKIGHPLNAYYSRCDETSLVHQVFICGFVDCSRDGRIREDTMQVCHFESAPHFVDGRIIMFKGEPYLKPTRVGAFVDLDFFCEQLGHMDMFHIFDEARRRDAPGIAAMNRLLVARGLGNDK